MPVVLAFPELGIIIVCVGCLIFLYLCVMIVKALFSSASGAVSWIPGVGGWLSGKSHDLEHKITNVFSTAIGKVDDAMGYSLHATARLLDWTGRELERHANLLHLLAQSMPGAGALGALRGEITALRRLLHGGFAAQLAQFRHLLDLEKRLQHGIGADVLPRIHGLERGFARTIEHDIASLRTRDRVLAREYERLYKWTRTHALAAGTLAFAGAVAVALGRLGMGWMRCPSFLRIGRRLGCGGFGALEDLLFGLVTAVAATDLCDLADAAGGVAHAIRPALMELVDVENALVGCHGATAPPSLDLAHPRLPPVRSPLQLTA